MHKSFNYIFISILLFSFIFKLPPWITDSYGWQEKVDPLLLEETDASAEFILFLNKQADLEDAVNYPTKLQKGEYVFQTLTQTAEISQKPILDILTNSGAEFRPYWIVNMIWVRGNPQLVKTFAMRKDIARVYANPTVRLDLPQPPLVNAQRVAAPNATTSSPWGILKVRANMVWGLGYTGQGITIGGQDTGYKWEHPALKNQYRGWDGSSADHNYNWHDAIHTPGVIPNPCGYDTTFPCDDGYHGTHTMGTMVGDDGVDHQIGMAPGARWIGCRNMDSGEGTPASYIECYQWFVAPTDLNGQNPRPDLAPDVINNSWSCPPSEGCNDPAILLTAVQNVRAAGIVTVHSAGNSGPACSTVNAPSAIYAESFSVGNTDLNDNINSSSSRGPVTVDGSQRMKPDVTAPGTTVYSSVPNYAYTYLTGTSMSGPHVAGLVALLLSARPDLIGNPDAIEYLITRSAVPLTTNEICGGVSGSQIPNNTYGWGRVDAWNTLVEALDLPTIYLPLLIKSY